MLKEYKTEKIRNVAIVGHSSTGKSTLLDAMLFSGGKIDRIGSSDDGTLVSDYEDDEKKRKMSIKSSMGFVESGDVKINIIDTPGMADFVGDVRSALQVAETAIIVVDSADGVQIETEKVWRYLAENNIPRIIFVNKMDKERANYESVLDNIKTRLNARVLPLSIPIGQGQGFQGTIDIIKKKAIQMKGGSEGQPAEIPPDYADGASRTRESAIETAAEGDDALIEKFLEGNELSDDEINKGIKNLLAQAKVVPVLCGATSKSAGIRTLLDTIVNYAQSPKTGMEYRGFNPYDHSKEIIVQSLPDKPMTSVVWKTNIDQYSGRFTFVKVISGEILPDTEILNAGKNYKERATKLYTLIGNKQFDMPKIICGDIGVLNKLEKTTTRDTLCDPKNAVLLPIINLPNPVFKYGIKSTNKADEDKIGQVFARIADENPTVHYRFDPETKETILEGMGEMQLDIILKSIAEKNKIEVKTTLPRIAYKETITKKAEAQYKHKKQSGGHGQYGEVYIRVAPLKRGQGFEFKDSIVGGVIPRQYIPGVEKGIREGLEEGVLAKYPVEDIWVELHFGSYHDVDSSEMSFKIAGRNAIKNAIESAGPQLLEPVMEVSIYADKDFTGDILNDITSRRGRVLGMGGDDDSGSGISTIKASAPLSEMLRYTIDLRSMTSGKGSFEMKFSHYDPISGKIAEKVIEERKKLLEEGADK